MDILGNTYLAEPDLQSQQSSKCDLLISISDNQFSFLIVDMLHDKLKAYKRIAFKDTDELRTIIDADPVMKFFFRKVKVSLCTQQFSFIPAELYEHEKLALYSAFLQTDQTEVSHLKTASIKNITSFDSELRRLITEKFPLASVLSQADPLIEGALKFYPSDGLQLFIEVKSTHFGILVTQSRQVIFYNIFKKENTDEFNYFLLLVMRQLEIKPGDCPVVLCGDITAGDDNFTRVSKYFTEIRFADSRKLMNVSETFDEIAPSLYFELSALLLCE